jgi:hypothetical protein
MRLWEVLWSNHLTQRFSTFFALAIVVTHRAPIIDQHMQFDEILKFINDLHHKLELSALLDTAERLYNAFHRLASRPGAVPDHVRLWFDC